MSEVETAARPGAFAAPARGWLARGTPKPALAPKPARRVSLYLVSFIAFVALPALGSTLYFAVLAADQFVAEARFAVHSPALEAVSDAVKAAKPTTASSLTGGLKLAGEDAYLVAAFIRSRACVEDVARALPLREIFRRAETDALARLKDNASAEELTDYWNGQVEAYVDPPSGIVTVKVAAFRREDALAIAEALLAAAERTANRVSERVRADVTKAAEREAAEAEARVSQSLGELRAFREQAGFIDPKLQAESLGRTLETLIAQRLKLETEYLVSSRVMSPEAPTLQSLKVRLDQYDAEIAAEKAKLTSASKDPAALANLLPQYEELRVRNAFAEKLYGFAADGLERAKLRAAAQAIYLDVFVPPALPQDALYPLRLASPILIALGCLIVWGIGALTAALIEDHKI